MLSTLILAQLVTWGPFLRDAEDGAVRVHVNLSGPCTAQAFAQDLETLEMVSGVPRFGDAPQIFLPGLMPGRVYAWSVRLTDAAGVQRWSGGPWLVRPTMPAGYRACLWGDSQLDGAGVFRPLVARMVAEGAELLVGVGDYIQNEGSAAEWDQLFAAPLGPVLRYLPVLGCRGNHDGEDTVARSRWTVPGSAGGQWGAITLGPVRWLVLDSNDSTFDLRVSMRPGGPQRAFLEAETSGTAWNAAPIRIALWHHPVLSERWDGGCYYPPRIPSDPDWTAAMDQLAARGCTLVVNGHAHAYQRGAWRGMAWIVSGGGGGWLDVTSCADAPEITFTAAEHHILTLDVAARGVLVRAVRADGTELDRIEARAR